MKVAFVGTDLAPLHPSSGALERVVLAWADGLRAVLPGCSTALVDADDPARPWAEQVDRLTPDLVVLNNRPLWSEQVSAPVAQVLHNYPDAWGTADADADTVRRGLGRGAVAAVSSALARHVEGAHRLDDGVREVRVAVESGFFEASWRGRGGPVLFPNRMLEKKGVRRFLELSRLLAGDGVECVMFRHLAPWTEPTVEQRQLLEAILECETVTLLPPPASRAEMAAWYARAGVVVCPSTHPEGLGLVALEAQAVGTPLVTSGNGGLADATYPPNEVVPADDLAGWHAAVMRAAHRSPSDATGALEAVASAHERAPATASFVELVEGAISRS